MEEIEQKIEAIYLETFSEINLLTHEWQQEMVRTERLGPERLIEE